MEDLSVADTYGERERYIQAMHGVLVTLAHVPRCRYFRESQTRSVGLRRTN